MYNPYALALEEELRGDEFDAKLTYEEFVSLYTRKHMHISVEADSIRVNPKESIKSIFDQECAHLKIDNAFAKSIIALQTRFVSKTQDHIIFFGGTLTGVQRVIFQKDDRDRLFYDVLEVDDETIKARVHSLGTVNPEYKVSSDIFNIACIWIMHALFNSHLLTEEVKREAIIAICQYLQYKFLTSKLYVYYRFQADEAEAKAVYAQMTKKYALKLLGSWGAVLRARATEAVSPTGIHADTIKRLEDLRVVYMLNDVQGRIRDILKNIYALHMRIRDQGTKIVTSSSFAVDLDGETILKDKIGGLVAYTRYIKTIVPNKESFIRAELCSVVRDALPAMPEKQFMVVLNWLCEHHAFLKGDAYETILDDILEHAFHYFSENPQLIRDTNDYAHVIEKLKGTYTSSRSTDPKLLNLRQRVEALVKEAALIKNDATVASVRTGVMIYIVLRSITKRHYTTKLKK